MFGRYLEPSEVALRFTLEVPVIRRPLQSVERARFTKTNCPTSNLPINKSRQAQPRQLSYQPTDQLTNLPAYQPTNPQQPTKLPAYQPSNIHPTIQ